ncbi:MAG: restriction endonuclease subunit S, partial [Verrucomicrobia bacterium]|nr:restriction endonuclease subunit S [Verrucomicrobiota bacterium]
MSEELPPGWATTNLNELVQFNPKHSPALDDATPVSFVPMAAVSESSPRADTSQTRPLGAVRKGYTHFADGDVLFAKITPCMENGKGGVASHLCNGLGCGTTELVVMRPSSALDPLFLYRFLAQPQVRREAKENFTGTAGQARVPTSFLEALQLPLPPLPEQRRIEAKLETLLGKVDACQHRLA